MSVTQDYKIPTFSLPERIEIRAALNARKIAIVKAIEKMAGDKNPRAYDALTTQYREALAVIDGVFVKVPL